MPPVAQSICGKIARHRQRPRYNVIDRMASEVVLVKAEKRFLRDLFRDGRIAAVRQQGAEDVIAMKR